MIVQKLKFSLIAGLFLAFGATAQSGGGFEVNPSVIAGGGGESGTGTFAVSGTIGQSVTGISSGGGFAVSSGFWGTSPVAPTAAAVSISGRVLSSGGGGIRNVELTLISGDGTVHRTLSSAFGYYRFDQIATGQSCVLQVSAKHFVFREATRVLDVRDELVGVDFVAQQN